MSDSEAAPPASPVEKEKTVIVESPPQNGSNLSEAEVMELVKKQIEYYFSKENLSNDAFLMSQMDAQMSVSLAVIMKFPKVKSLTQDENVIRKSLADSTICSIVDDRIKAMIKSTGRSTIILREIPSDAPIMEVKEIFDFEGCKQISSIRSEIGDTWFVAMETEEAAKDTLIDLRLKKRQFRGKAVKAGLKTETVVKSFYTVQNTPPVAPMFPMTGMMPYGNMMGMPNMGMYGYNMPGGMNRNQQGMYGPGGVPGVVPSMPSSGMHVQSMEMGELAGKSAKDRSDGNDAQNAVDGASAAQSFQPSKNEGGRKIKGGNSSGGSEQGSKSRNNQSSGGRNKGGNNSNNNNNNGNHAREHRDKEKNKDAGSATASKQSIDISVANFPPLGDVAPMDDTPIPTPGYKGAYNKYSFDEIISIVKTIKEAPLPQNFDPTHHPLAMDPTVNMDLLQKQRSYSIDETRELLRQGRPVNKEAVLAGAIDSRSWAFGDEISNASAPSTSKQAAAPPGGAASGVRRLSEDNINAKPFVPASQQATKNAAATTTATVATNTPPVPTAAAVVAGGNSQYATATAAVMPVVAESAASTSTTTSSANAAAAPTSPSSIPMSTWAAMLKSNATALETTNANQSASIPMKWSQNGPSRSPSDKKGTAAAAGVAKSGGSSSNNSKQSTGAGSTSRRDGGGRDRDRRRGEGRDGGEKKERNKGKEATGDSQRTNEGVADSSAVPSTWGGKSTFANIVKTLNEEPAPMTASTATTKSSSTNATKKESGRSSSESSNSKSDSNSKGGRGNNNNNNNNNGNRSTSVSTDAAGLWVKATLPSLPNEKK